jgi:hypothetical protein
MGLVDGGILTIGEVLGKDPVVTTSVGEVFPIIERSGVV